MNTIKYDTLLKILDKIREEAPEEYKSYKIENTTKEDPLNIARSKAFIHLFLKVKCGITNFKDRHSCITEGTQDGGIDAYYIDSENKKLFLIQSKFRTTEDNFTSKTQSADDLVKIEVNRILKGEGKDTRGNEYNSKIKEFQKLWSEIGDQASYDYKIIILGNVKNYTDEQIKRLIDFSKYEIFDFERTYNELVFPLCSGTYYDPKEITITINLYNKEQSTLKQSIITQNGEYDVRITFVPTEEIAKVTLKYKNSLLKYNPRNYLTLSRNKVNKSIKDSIVNNNTNDFAIFNNGITILAEKFYLSETTGKKFRGQLILTNPQIINGGQTAYTLSKIYEENQHNLSVFENKEVMFKIIIPRIEEEDPNIQFIEKISNATNKQTNVDEADRRSNAYNQVKIQNSIFEEYGYFYERKRGEFFNGEENNYIDKKNIIDRYDFLRAYHAFKGNPSGARQKSSEVLFRLENFNKILDSPANYKKMFFSWQLLEMLHEIESREHIKEWKDFEDFKDYRYGFSLRYGKMAIVAAVGVLGVDESKLDKNNIIQHAKEKLHKILSNWDSFENSIKSKSENSDYFAPDPDFDNYYKGKTLNQDIAEFFKEFKEKL